MNSRDGLMITGHSGDESASLATSPRSVCTWRVRTAGSGMGLFYTSPRSPTSPPREPLLSQPATPLFDGTGNSRQAARPDPRATLQVAGTVPATPLLD